MLVNTRYSDVFATLNGPLESQQKKVFFEDKVSFMFIDLNSGMILVLEFSLTGRSS